MTVTFLNARVNNISFAFLPNALYFLVVACNANVSVQATTGTNGLVGMLMGEPDFVTFGSTSVTGSWSGFTAHMLPATFGAATWSNTTNVPNIYVGF